MAHDKQTGVRMDSADLKVLAKIAKEKDRSIAYIMRVAIREYIERYNSTK
jgi:predicted transcriptional regulator